MHRCCGFWCKLHTCACAPWIMYVNEPAKDVPKLHKRKCCIHNKRNCCWGTFAPCLQYPIWFPVTSKPGCFCACTKIRHTHTPINIPLNMITNQLLVASQKCVKCPCRACSWFCSSSASEFNVFLVWDCKPNDDSWQTVGKLFHWCDIANDSSRHNTMGAARTLMEHNRNNCSSSQAFEIEQRSSEVQSYQQSTSLSKCLPYRVLAGA